MTVKEYRQRIGTQAEVARILNVDRTRVAQWDCGRAIPNRNILRKVAALCGCTIDELYDAFDETCKTSNRTSAR